MANQDRRLSERQRLDKPQGLSITKGDREIAAQLVDVSEGGVGVDTFVGFDLGAVIHLKGELVRPGLGLRLNGYARVAHSSEIEPGRFRIGLEFVEVAYARAS